MVYRKPTRKQDPDFYGETYWDESMDQFIGKIGRIDSINLSRHFLIIRGMDSWAFPLTSVKHVVVEKDDTKAFEKLLSL